MYKDASSVRNRLGQGLAPALRRFGEPEAGHYRLALTAARGARGQSAALRNARRNARPPGGARREDRAPGQARREESEPGDPPAEKPAAKDEKPRRSRARASCAVIHHGGRGPDCAPGRRGGWIRLLGQFLAFRIDRRRVHRRAPVRDRAQGRGLRRRRSGHRQPACQQGRRDRPDRPTRLPARRSPRRRLRWLERKPASTMSTRRSPPKTRRLRRPRRRWARRRRTAELARVTWGRDQPLVKQGWATAQQGTTDVQNLKAQQAAVDSAQAALKVAQRQIDTLRAQRTSAEAPSPKRRPNSTKPSSTSLTRPSRPTSRAASSTLPARSASMPQAGTNLSMFVPDEIWVVANFKETQLDRMRPVNPSTSRSTPIRNVRSTAMSIAFSPAQARPSRCCRPKTRPATT